MTPRTRALLLRQGSQGIGRSRVCGRAGVAAALAVLLATGCAATDRQAPTHRWVAMDQVSGVEYRVDNNQCARETLGEAGPRVIKTNTEAYRQYVSCMNERGYVLTAYSDAEKDEAGR